MDRKNILLIDDDAHLLETLKEILVSEGYCVDTATTGLKALEIMKSSHDLIIVDIFLPDIQGDHLVQRIRSENSGVNIIMITGTPDLKRCINALDLGIYDILLKPVTPEEILRVIREVFQKTQKTICK